MRVASPLIRSSRPTKRKYGRVAAGSGACGRGLGAREEERQVPHRSLEPALAVCSNRESARREEEVDFAGAAIEHAAVAPELRRPPERERAAEALRLLARLPVVLPEHVHRADEPVLVRRVELHAAAKLEHAGTADQRDVVEVDDVERLAEDPGQLL